MKIGFAGSGSVGSTAAYTLVDEAFDDLKETFNRATSRFKEKD
jgi:malate/lactate dehydrogenase